MTKKQALSILKPEANTIEAVKVAYRKAALTYHPDHGGNEELMKLVNLAFERLMEEDWTPYEARAAARETPLTEVLQKLWESVHHFPNIRGEIIGTWLWVTGDTKPYKEQLKELKFRWSHNKTAWYFHEGPYRKRSRKDFSMDDIRREYGFEDLEKEELRQVG